MGSASNFRASRWLVLFTIFAMFAAACGDGEGDTTPDTDPDATPTDEATEPTEEPVEEETTEPEAAEGGTIVWGYEQEPGVLNPTTTDGNMLATSQVALAVLHPLWIITPEFAYEPSPLLEDAEVNDDGESFSVTYNLNPDATWSDGEPITADDVLFTLETCLNEEWDITSREGCDKVDMEATEAGMDPEGSTIEVIFTEPYAPWQTMFSTADGIILPRHVLEGEDWNTVWNDELPISSAPFAFESWDKGQQITLARNEDYFGEPAKLDRLVYRYIPDSNTIVQQLRGGEIDMMNPQPQLDLIQQIEGIEGVELQTDSGPVWEHIDFQASRPPLDQAYVRQALSMAIDREAIIEQIILPINPDAEPLNSIVYVNNQDEYEDHYSEFVSHDPDGAVALLEENGCERGDDNIFTCEGERMEFEFTTIAGNERRELTFEIVQAQFEEIGVVLNPDLAEAAIQFAADKLDAGDWDMFEFAWVGSPDPASNVELWKCEGDQNYHRHCSEEASELLEQTSLATDADERARLMNEAGQILASEVPVLPLYQLPEVVAFHGDRVRGPQVNATQWGMVWNVGDWEALGG